MMRIEAKHVSRSDHGVIKYLIKLSDGNHIESVLIPHNNHLTICASTQVGCPVKCRFCLTGKDKFVRNLSTREITDQVMIVEKDIKGSSKIDIVAFMGMGEPLLNYDNVIGCIRRLQRRTSGHIKHYFISTVGMIPQLTRLSKEQGINVNLFISLNATQDSLRKRLIPARPYYPIDQIMAAVDDYSQSTKTEFRPTIAYLLLNGVNDSVQDAKRLVKLLVGRPYTVYLKEYCETGAHGFRRSSNIKRFKKIIDDSGTNSIVNTSRGKDILAGCGQLRQRFLITR